MSVLSRLAALIILVAASPAWADTYFVRAGGNDALAGDSPGAAWASVTHAASRAQAGDTVYVGAGVYPGTVRPSHGGSAASPVRFVADADGSHTGDAGDVELNRIEVGNAKHHVHFHGFVLRGSSGPIVWDQSQHGLLEGVTVRDATNAVMLRNNASLTMRDCAVADVTGYGLRVQNGSATVEGCVFDGVSGNAVESPNAGSTIEIVRCTLSRSGRGVLVSSSTARIINTLIHSVTGEGVRAQNNANVTVVHCTVADTGGDGLYANAGSHTVRNTIFAGIGGDAIDRINMAGVSVSHCLFHDVTGEIARGMSLSDPLVADPLFTDPAAGVYALGDLSPAIDQGADASAYTAVDRIGRARPAGAGWDVGAYEGVGGVVAEGDAPGAGGGGRSGTARRVVRWAEVSPVDD